MRYLVHFATGCALLVLTACAASYPTSPTNPTAVTAVRILFLSSSGGTIRADTSFVLDGYALNQDNVWQRLSVGSWQSSNPAVLQVFGSSSGFIGAKAPGSARITFTYQGQTASLDLTVAPATYPYIDARSSLTLYPGTTATARAYLYPSAIASSQDVTFNATWTSATPDIATVRTDGTITGIAPGNAEIRVSVGNVTAVLYVSVLPPVRFY